MSLGEEVSNIISIVNMWQRYSRGQKVLTYKVNIHNNMFGLILEDRVINNFYDTDVICKERCRCLYVNTKIIK